MSLVDHAERELRKAGLFDSDSDYGGAMANSVMDLIRLFASQRHSGASADLAIVLFKKLAKFKTLTPITDDPDEWTDVSSMSGRPFWQNKRDSRYFSEDAGQTWYSIEDDEKKTKLL